MIISEYSEFGYIYTYTHYPGISHLKIIYLQIHLRTAYWIANFVYRHFECQKSNICFRFNHNTMTINVINEGTYLNCVNITSQIYPSRKFQPNMMRCFGNTNVVHSLYIHLFALLFLFFDVFLLCYIAFIAFTFIFINLIFFVCICIMSLY